MRATRGARSRIAQLQSEPREGEQVERLAARLRGPQPPAPNHVHGELDGCFAGALQVEEDRLLPGQVVPERCRLARMHLTHASHAALVRSNNT